MKTNKKSFISVLAMVLALTVSVGCLCGCGKDGGSKKKDGYKAVAEDFAKGFKDLDAKKIIGLMHDDVVEQAAEEEDMDKDEFIEEFQDSLDEIKEEVEEDYNWKKIKYEIGDDDDLDDDDLEELNEQYEDLDLEIKEAKKVEITFTTPAVDKDEDDKEESFEIIVGKIDKSWYLVDMGM